MQKHIVVVSAVRSLVARSNAIRSAVSDAAGSGPAVVTVGVGLYRGANRGELGRPIHSSLKGIVAHVKGICPQGWSHFGRSQRSLFVAQAPRGSQRSLVMMPRRVVVLLSALHRFVNDCLGRLKGCLFSADRRERQITVVAASAYPVRTRKSFVRIARGTELWLIVCAIEVKHRTRWRRGPLRGRS